MSDPEPITPAPDTTQPAAPRKPKRQPKSPRLPEEQWLVVKQIAEQLNEPKRGLLVTLVKHTSLDFALELLQETLTIEAQGGLMTVDGSRHRTPGGVFFFLARQRLPPEISQQVFPKMTWKERKALKKQQKRERREQRPTQKPKRSTPPTPEYSPFIWEERQPLIAALLETPGTATTAKVTVTGRPESFKLYADLAFITLTAPPHSSVPHGVPKPESGLGSTYAVLIGLKHWKKVDAALRADRSDFLIIEGIYAYHEPLNGMAIYATNATTRNLEQERREKKPE